MSEAASTESTTEKMTVSSEVFDAIHLIAQGKRNMMCTEVAQATQQFQEACRILGAEYGETADECGDAYYWYGKALLEMSRMEGGLLGDGVATGDSEESQSEEEDASEEQEEVKEGEEAVTTSGNEEDEEEGALSEDIEDEEAEPKKAPAVENGKAAAKINENGNASTCDMTLNTTADELAAEDGEDVSNLQLAWEMMELAKLIYNRREGREMKLKLAETYLKLGEIGMETEQYDQAITDLTDCLALLRTNLSPEDRLIAETFYQLGVASTMNKQYDEAVRYYRDAITVIEKKIKYQRRVVSGEVEPEVPVGGAEPDGFYSVKELAQKELEEMAEIIPDILARIDDVEDEKNNADRVRLLMNENVTSTHGSSTSQSAHFNGNQSASSSSCQTVSSVASTPSSTDVRSAPLAEISSSYMSQSAALSSKPAATLGQAINENATSVFSGFSYQSSSVTSTMPITNITHLVRKKRKTDDTETDETKRVKTDETAISSAATSTTTATTTSPAAVDQTTNDVTTVVNGDHSRPSVEKSDSNEEKETKNGSGDGC